jgi:hypothetical protein
MSVARAQGIAPDRSLCVPNCESEKKLCRSADGSPAVFAAASLLALVLDQPKAFATPSTLDNKRDMRDVLEARQRAADEVRAARREIDEKCNSAYLQCRGACLSAPPSITKP